MIRAISVSLFITFFAFRANAQSVIAISAGVSTDLNNEKPFYSVPVTLRWEPFKRSAFFIEATQAFGLNRLADADAYTTSPQLPQQVSLAEAIHANSLSIGTGAAIILYTKKNNRFTLNLSAGFCSEEFTVIYRNYDKANYEVLNPDVSEKMSGLYVSAAGVYNFHKTKQDMFLMLRIQSPSTASPADRYTLSYNKTAALQLTFGYKLFYNQKRGLPVKQ
jgi:hypothetical protein